MKTNNTFSMIDSDVIKLEIGTVINLRTPSRVIMNYRMNDDYIEQEEITFADKVMDSDKDEYSVKYHVGHPDSGRKGWKVDLEIVKIEEIDRKAVRVYLNDNFFVDTTSNQLLSQLTETMAKYFRNIEEKKDYLPLYHPMPGNMHISRLDKCELYESKWVAVETLKRGDFLLGLPTGFKMHTSQESFISTDGRVVAIGEGTKYVYLTADAKQIMFNDTPLDNDVIRHNFGDEALTFDLDDVHYHIAPITRITGI